MDDDHRGCWSCGAHGPCLVVCYCAKCLDPVDYAAWMERDRSAHAAWWDRQRLRHGESCSCPSCTDW